MQMNVYGSGLLQTRCRPLIAVGLLSWAAYWHCYAETMGRTCTTNPINTCTCLSIMLTPTVDPPFPAAGFQEFSGLLEQSSYAEAHRNSLSRKHSACLCIGHTHRSRSNRAYVWLITQSEHESADRDSRLQRTNLTVVTTASVPYV